MKLTTPVAEGVKVPLYFVVVPLTIPVKADSEVVPRRIVKSLHAKAPNAAILNPIDVMDDPADKPSAFNSATVNNI